MIIKKELLDEFFSFSKGFAIFTIVLFHLISNYAIELQSLIRKVSVFGGFGIFVFSF